MVKFRAEAAQSDPVMQFVMCLLHSVTNAHILHFQSLSYSQHMALGAYYDEVSDLVDGFVEAFQVPDNNPVTYLTYLKEEVATLRRASGFPQDSELQNEVDTIANLINSTLYKLRFLP